MATDETEKKPKLVNRKHLARVEKENQQRKILRYSIIAVVVIVVGLIVYGVLDTTVLKDIKPVAKIGSTTITVDQFEKRVQFERQQMVSQYLAYATSSYAYFFQSSLQSVQDSLDNYVQFGSDTLDQMINEKLLVEKAKEMGITVTDEEVNKYIEENFGFYPDGTPTAQPTRKVDPTSTLSSLQLTLVGPTATELVPTEEATATATVSATAESQATVEGQATGKAATPTATLELPTFTPTVTESPTVVPTITMTPTPYTREGYEALYKTSVANIASATGFGDPEIREYFRDILTANKVIEAVTKDIAEKQEVVWARHILVGTEAEAQTILQKLKDGEDFAKLASEMSTDTGSAASGGDLGWFIKGQMVKEFEDAAFSLKIGEISEPVKSEHGYHIIQVLGHETRTLTDEELSNAKQIAYNTFLTKAKEEITIKKYDIWASVVPSEPSIPTEYRLSTAQ